MLHFLYLQEWNPAKEVLSVLHMSYVYIRETEGIKEEERNSIGGCLTAVSSFIKAHPHFPSDNQTLLSNSVKLIHHSPQKNLFPLSRVEENGFDPKEKGVVFLPCFASSALFLWKGNAALRQGFKHQTKVFCISSQAYQVFTILFGSNRGLHFKHFHEECWENICSGGSTYMSIYLVLSTSLFIKWTLT